MKKKKSIIVFSILSRNFNFDNFIQIAKVVAQFYLNICQPIFKSIFWLVYGYYKYSTSPVPLTPLKFHLIPTGMGYQMATRLGGGKKRECANDWCTMDSKWSLGSLGTSCGVGSLCGGGLVVKWSWRIGC